MSNGNGVDLSKKNVDLSGGLLSGLSPLSPFELKRVTKKTGWLKVKGKTKRVPEFRIKFYQFIKETMGMEAFKAKRKDDEIDDALGRLKEIVLHSDPMRPEDYELLIKLTEIQMKRLELCLPNQSSN